MKQSLLLGNNIETSKNTAFFLKLAVTFKLIIISPDKLIRILPSGKKKAEEDAYRVVVLH